MRIGFLVSLACSVALLAGCAGSGTLDRHKVEQQVARQLAAKFGERPKAVVCPGDLKAKVGTTMRCQLEAKDGSKFVLTLTVTSVQGSDVKFHIQVDNKVAS